MKLLPPLVTIEATSPVYDTDPMYFQDQPRFYNIVVRGKTKLSPADLLAHTQSIEVMMGREGKTHNRPRVIDIDILFYGDETVDTPDLILPHPRIAQRAFVLVPMCDIAPKFVHPVLRVTVADLLKRLTGWEDQVKPTNISV